jgi:hypothetical protein
MEPTQEQLDAFYKDLFDDEAFKRSFQEHIAKLLHRAYVKGVPVWDLDDFDPEALARNLQKIDQHDMRPGRGIEIPKDNGSS